MTDKPDVLTAVAAILGLTALIVVASLGLGFMVCNILSVVAKASGITPHFTLTDYLATGSSLLAVALITSLVIRYIVGDCD